MPRPRWVFLTLILALLVAWLVYWYQTKAAWTVSLKEGSDILSVAEDAGIILLDENTVPTIYPSSITTRSLTTGQWLSSVTLEKNTAPWHDSADAQFSPDQRYLLLSEGYRRDGRGILVLYDLKTGKPLRDWSLKSFDQRANTFSRDSKFLIIGKEDSANPDNSHVVRLVNLGDLSEKRIAFPGEHDTSIVQVETSDDLAYLVVRVVNRRDRDYRVYLLDTRTGQVAGQWECCDEPLLHLGPQLFAFQIAQGEGQQQLVTLNVNQQPYQLQPLDGLVFARQTEPEVLYHYQGITFQHFCEEAISRLVISAVGTSAYSQGLALYSRQEPSVPFLWLRDWLMKLQLIRPMYQIHWLAVTTKRCSEPLWVPYAGKMEVISSGVVHLDDQRLLRFTRYPSRWRWWWTILSAGITLVIGYWLGSRRTHTRSI